MAQAFSPFGQTRQRGSEQPSMAQTLAAHGLDALRFIQRTIEHAVRPSPEVSRQLAGELRGTNPALASRVESRLPARISSQGFSYAPDHGHSPISAQPTVREPAQGHDALAREGSTHQPAFGHEHIPPSSGEDARRRKRPSP